jgi:hypothetical protein
MSDHRDARKAAGRYVNLHNDKHGLDTHHRGRRDPGEHATKLSKVQASGKPGAARRGFCGLCNFCQSEVGVIEKNCEV